MNTKQKIIVAGIGGVGGYFGGLLASHYHLHKNVEIYFIARGKHLENIQAQGLCIEHNDKKIIAFPTEATDDPAHIGIADYIILCTKNYDLSAMVAALKPCIGKDTTLLPLLNGLDNFELLQQLLPGTNILRACVYVVSRMKAPGIIQSSGDLQKIYLGPGTNRNMKAQKLESLFTAAGIDAQFIVNILPVIWEKYIFIGPIATATSFFDKSIGEIVATPSQFELLCQLIEEVKRVALANNITLENNITQKIIDRIKSLPYHNTSSMHNDFKSGKGATELLSLTYYVIQCGEALHIPTPIFEKMYAYLQTK